MIKKKTKTARPQYGKHIKEIYRLFIKPYLVRAHYHDDESSLREGLDLFFNVETRDVFFAYATKDFTMPGKLWRQQTPTTAESHLVLREPLLYQRKIKEGTPLICRVDSMMPDRIDVELAQEGLVFAMKEAEWEWVKEHIEPYHEEEL